MDHTDQFDDNEVEIENKLDSGLVKDLEEKDSEIARLKEELMKL